MVKEWCRLHSNGAGSTGGFSPEELVTVYNEVVAENGNLCALH